MCPAFSDCFKNWINHYKYKYIYLSNFIYYHKQYTVIQRACNGAVCDCNRISLMAALQNPENEHNTYRLWTSVGKHDTKPG